MWNRTESSNAIVTEKMKYYLWIYDRWAVLIEKKYIELTEEDRAKVTSVYHNWRREGYEETYENVPEFCYSASFDEVKEKGFVLGKIY